MYNCLFVFNIKVEIQSLGLWVNEKLTSNLFCTIATTVNIRLLSLIISRRANSNLIWYIGTCTTNLCRSVFVPQTINWNHNSALDLLYTFIVYSKIRCSQSFLKAFVARPSWRDFSPSREPLRVPVDSESFRTGRYRCEAFYTRKHYTFSSVRVCRSASVRDSVRPSSEFKRHGIITITITPRLNPNGTIKYYQHTFARHLCVAPSSSWHAPPRRGHPRRRPDECSTPWRTGRGVVRGGSLLSRPTVRPGNAL